MAKNKEPSAGDLLAYWYHRDSLEQTAGKAKPPVVGAFVRTVEARRALDQLRHAIETADAYLAAFWALWASDKASQASQAIMRADWYRGFKNRYMLTNQSRPAARKSARERSKKSEEGRLRLANLKPCEWAKGNAHVAELTGIPLRSVQRHRQKNGTPSS